MMSFTLNMLCLMRDYNGRLQSARSPPCAFRPTSHDKWRAVIRDRSNNSHRAHWRVMKFRIRRGWKKFTTSTLCRCRKKYKICIYPVDGWKTPIMISINHPLRCLNLARTLVWAHRHPAPVFLSLLGGRKTIMIMNRGIIQWKYSSWHHWSFNDLNKRYHFCV